MFQVLLCITNNLIKHKSFVYKQFKYRTVLFEPQIGPYQVLPLRVWEDLRAMEMNKYFKLPRAPGLDPHH